MSAVFCKCSYVLYSALDPFLQHVNKELKEKEIQAVDTNPQNTHQLKVRVSRSSYHKWTKALSKAMVLEFSSSLQIYGLPAYMIHTCCFWLARGAGPRKPVRA